MITLFVLPLILGFAPIAVGAQSGRPAKAIAAVRPRAPRASPRRARAIRRVFCSQYLASSILFSGVCGAVDTVLHRLADGGECLRRGALGAANYGVCWELGRTCGGLCVGRLRARGVVIPARHYS